VSVEETAELPQSFELGQNYPNPFNPTTVISFQLPVVSEVKLVIYNTQGQLVKKLVAGELAAGRHDLTWDATDDRGMRVASGVYFYVVRAGEAFAARRKMLLMK
jgi:flagellar hook assembly protein FlgD